MTRLIVTGSREWTDRAVVEAALRRLPVGRLAHGACVWGGLDEIADEIARALGWEVAPYPVLPGERPTARNIRMVDAERPTIVLAFPLPGSRGTWHCARYAVSRGVETWVLQRETWLAYGERAKAEPTPVTDGRYR